MKIWSAVGSAAGLAVFSAVTGAEAGRSEVTVAVIVAAIPDGAVDDDMTGADGGDTWAAGGDTWAAGGDTWAAGGDTWAAGGADPMNDSTGEDVGGAGARSGAATTGAGRDTCTGAEDTGCRGDMAVRGATEPVIAEAGAVAVVLGTVLGTAPAAVIAGDVGSTRPRKSPTRVSTNWLIEIPLVSQ